MMIDSRAVIDPTAKIAANVEIGPFSIVGANVEIGAGTWIGANAVVFKNTILGENNKIYQFASIGADPQDVTFANEKKSYLIVGNNNTFHPCVTINRGTAKQDCITRIGDDNFFMAYAHIAHDCTIGNHTIFANNATLAGHIIVDDYATIGAFCAIHQFCNVGRYSYVTRGAMVVKDILPYLLVSGNQAKTHGLNRVGLQRHGFNQEILKRLQQAYKIIFRQALTLESATRQLVPLVKQCVEIEHLIVAIERADRGIVR